MPFNLLDEAKNMLPNDLISKAAGSLGESEGSIRKGLNGAIPSVLACLLGKSSGSVSSDEMLEIVKEAAGSGIISNLNSLFDNTSMAAAGGKSEIGAIVMGWSRSIFGGKLNNIVNAISGFAGIKSSSASAVLNMAAPAALAPVGKYAMENNLSAPDLSSFLQSQKSSILNAIPSGFNLTGALGINTLGDIGSNVSNTISSATENARDKRKKATSYTGKWLFPLLVLVTIAALIWFFIQKK